MASSLGKVSWMHAVIHSLSGGGEGKVVELIGDLNPYVVEYGDGLRVHYNEDDIVQRLGQDFGINRQPGTT